MRESPWSFPTRVPPGRRQVTYICLACHAVVTSSRYVGLHAAPPQIQQRPAGKSRCQLTEHVSRSRGAGRIRRGRQL